MAVIATAMKGGGGGGDEGGKKYITSEELMRHNKPGDLWICIQGKVYDVSKWAKEHPGGEIPLLNLAGEDVTDAFIAYHPGTAWRFLENLFTGFHLQDYHVSDVSKDFRRLAAEFSKAGLFERKGHVAMYALAVVALLMGFVLYGVLLCESLWAHMAAAVALGFVWMQGAYVGHDSGHYQAMKSRGYNKLAQMISGNCLTGISIAWWKWTHNAHHLAVNSLDYDPDLQHIPFFAVSTKLFASIRSVFYGRQLSFDPVARLLVSYQHWTFYPVMVFGRINLYVQTFLLLFSSRPVPDRALNIVGIAFFWTWFPLLVSCLPSWNERALFVLVSFTVTSVQHIQFCLNHFPADHYLGPPEGTNWFEKQTAGTVDISCSKWMDWFHGGLQFQLEHHLFPRLPRGQLRLVSPLVKDLCKKHGLPYRSYSFFEANVVTIKTLRAVALLARDASNPIPNNMVWEALHTHG